MDKYSRQICFKKPIFKGVFMRDTLPPKPNKIEIGILNLDSINNSGTHWTLFYKNNEKHYYFDSFGHSSPKELDNYFKHDIICSTYILQKIGTNVCGVLCLKLMANIIKTNNFELSLLELKENGI